MAEPVVIHGFSFGPGDYLTPGYAAELAGVTPDHLKFQPIPSARDARGNRRYLVADVLAWCEARDQAVEANRAAMRKPARP